MSFHERLRGRGKRAWTGLAGDERFTTNAQRSLHRSELKRELEAALASLEVDSLADRLIRNAH